MEHNTGKKQSLIAGQLDLLVQNVQGYIETRIEIAKLDAKSEGVNVVSRMITGLIGASLVSMATLFLLIGLALLLGELLGHNSWGFLIVFVLFLVIFFAFCKNFSRIEKYMNVFLDNELKRISEKKNIPQEAIQTSEAQEPRPSDTSEKEGLNHLEMPEEDDDIILTQKTSFEKEKD